MIDWHSHILPAMDDGSRNINESILMLDSLKGQGASLVIATPHFYANEESVEAFLQRRKFSYDLLSQNISTEHPRVLCGSEVRYYPGIAKMKELGELAVEGTKILLLEMPVARWTEYTVKELIELEGTRGLIVVLAHIERYLALQNQSTFERLSESGLLMQVNASFFERIGSRHKALKLLKSGIIQFVGSDCHNLTSRPPNLKSAYEHIEKKFGKYYIDQMDEFGYRALGHK